MICKELATGATLDQVLCICPGRWPIESCTEGLASKSPRCGVMAAEASMYFGQELPSLLFGDASLKNSSSTFLVEFTFMNHVGFRTSNDAMSLILVLGECRCQNRRISGRGSRTVRLRRMVTGDKGHDVFTHVRALSLEVKPYSCLIHIDDMGSTRVDLPRDRRG